MRSKRTASETGPRWVLEPEAVQLLSMYKIPYPEHGLARGPEDAALIADGLGYPVVLKVVSPQVIHKSDAGGVVTGLEDAGSVRLAYEAMIGNVRTAVPEATIEGALVCKQAAEGLEVIVGAVDDAIFGATVMFGLGGIFAEVLEDVSFRIAPLKRRDAHLMVEEIHGYSLLTGARERTRCDVAALVELLLTISRIVMDRSEVKELDLNPVRVYEEGVMILDARLLEKGER